MTAGSQLITGRFALEAPVGSGGMGTIYRARDERTGARVALKKLRADVSGDSGRFLRETHVLAELDHPGIVRYVAHGIDESGEPFLAMEWLEGESLAERLRRGPLALEESLAVIEQVAAALAFAHARGVVHRDVKPANLFLVDGRIDRARVLDFGIARWGGGAGGGAGPTMPGTVLGTLGYMAPEQATDGGSVDARADLFSLGCVWFETLAGRPAFLGDNSVALLAKILLEEVPPLGEVLAAVPPAVESLVSRMLSKSRDARPRDGAALVAELRAIAEGRGALASDGGAAAHAAGRADRGITAGERRLVSVVIAEPEHVASSQASTVRPHEARAALDRLRAAVAPFGARMESLAQGTLLVVLAGSGAAVDLAAKAARCALALRDELPGARMALATGRGELAGPLPVGQALDRASRLLRTPVAPAPEGGPLPLRVDEVTAGLLDPRFDVGGDDAGLLLRAENAEREQGRTVLGHETPFVGRERDLGALVGYFDECADEPLARAVLVTAPPGYGKSRLRHEMVAVLAKREAPPRLWVGRGDPIGAGAPFRLVGGALRRAAGVREGEDPAVSRRKLRARVARYVAATEVDRVTEFAGEIAGVSFPDAASPPLRAARQNPRLMADQITRAFIDLASAECAQRPLLIVLEDLHWGDGPSARLVDAALAALRDKPLMVLALARPEVHEAFPRLFAERRAAELRLGELPRKAGEKIARAVLGDKASDDTLRDVVERSAGNALYLEELIRAYARGDRAHLPETVLAMFAARLEALEPAARRVLRAASVFGQAFRAAGVAAVLGGENELAAAREWLPRLEQRELVNRRPNARAPGEDEWFFRHALVREAAYAMLTEPDRVLGHRLAGAWLEVAGERDPAVLARHAERAQDPARAVLHYRRAAEHALEGHDFAGALAHVDAAVACGAKDEWLGALRLVQGLCHQWRGEVAPSEARAEEALALLAPGSSSWYRAHALCVDGAGKRARVEKLEALADLLEARGFDGPPTANQANAWAHAVVYLEFCGRHARAESLRVRLEQAQRESPSDDVAVSASLSRLRANARRREGDVSGYLAEMGNVMSVFAQIGNLRTLCFEEPNYALGLIEVGAYGPAVEKLESALATAESMGLRFVAAAARQNLGYALMCTGRTDEALVVEGRSLSDLEAQGERRMAACSRVYLATILLRAGRAADAEREAREAAEDTLDAPDVRAGALAVLARALVALGRGAEALESARVAAGFLDAVGYVEEGEATLRLALAEALDATGDAAGARAAIASARARLIERAGRIRDAATAEGFLRNVHEHRRTMDLAEAWGAATPTPRAAATPTPRASHATRPRNGGG